MTQLDRVLAEHNAVEALLNTARADAAETQAARGHHKLHADDGIDYRRRVLAALTGTTASKAHPGDAEAWKAAYEHLTRLGL